MTAPSLPLWLFGATRAVIFKAAVLAVAIIVSNPIAAWASDARSLRFEALGREKGLSTDTITTIYQDKAGFLWIGSRDGLRVYDGYSFHLYEHDISDPQSLSDNSIRTVFEDSKGRFWVGTNAGGLELLDRTTGKFRHFRHDPADADTLSHDSVYAIVEDGEGRLWVGTQRGLNRLDPSTFRIQRIQIEPKNSAALPNAYVGALYIDRVGNLWVGTVGEGLCRRDPQNGQFTIFRNDPHQQRSISSDRIFAITEDENGDVWLGTDKGVNKVDPNTGVSHRFLLSASAESNENVVTSLSWNGSDTLLVGTLAGLNEIDANGKIVNRQRQDGELTRGLKIISLLADRAGHVWIGTWGRGLIRGTQKSVLFSVIGNSPTRLSDRDVTEIVVDHSGRLWVGTVGGGLDVRDRGSENFHHYPIGTYGSAILAIFEDEDHSIWVGTYEGLERIAPDGAQVTKYIHDHSNPESIGPGYVTDILRDHDGQLWVGTGGGGLNRLRRDGRGFERFVQSATDPQSLSDDYITAIRVSKEGTLWVGTRSGGLNECEARTMRCRRYLPGEKDSIGHQYVTSIHEDANGRIWVGTAGGGLNLFESPRSPGHKVTRFTSRDGLPDDNVMSIDEDEGSLWLGTKHGLARFNLINHEVVNFGLDDGLPSEGFNGSSSARDEDYLYMGSPAGLLMIRRGSKWEPAVASPTVLTALEVEGADQSNLSMRAADKIEVPYGSIITFEAAVLEFGETSVLRYEYQLQGLSDAWVRRGQRRGTTFSGLSPGMYTLRVRGRNERGLWSNASPVHFQVVPPFWMRSWFRALVLISVAALIIGIHRYRTASLKEHNRELLTIQGQREQALYEARNSEEQLQAAYARLQSLTRRIDAVAEEERKHIAHELHDELGQALTAAKINLQLLPSPSDAEERIKRIADTVNLVDDMISRVRALSLDLRPPLLYELGLMPALRAFAESQARRSGLEITIDSPPLEQRLSGETEVAAFRVMQEAMTNVIRHAQATHVGLRITMHDGFVDLEIRDNGVGFDVRSLQSRVEMGHEHFGLAGIRERAELLGGNALIQSIPGSGTSITVKIPAVPVGEAICD